MDDQIDLDWLNQIGSTQAIAYWMRKCQDYMGLESYLESGLEKIQEILEKSGEDPDGDFDTIVVGGVEKLIIEAQENLEYAETMLLAYKNHPHVPQPKANSVGNK